MFSIINQFNRFIETGEFNRFGIMTLTITAGSCWASIAAMLILKNESPVWQLSVCASLAMAANAIAIAQLPFKWVIWSFILSVVVNGLLIVGNLF